MASLLVIRRILAFTLAVTLASMGVPLPVNASGEQEQPSAPNSVLTLNGQPIRQFVSTAGHSRDVLLFSGLTQAQPSNDQISGVAVDTNFQRLAQHEVQLKRVLQLGGQRVTGVATTTTDAGGRFSFTGLAAGSFEVEVLIGEELVTKPVELSAGAMVVSRVILLQPPERPRMGRGTKIAIGVGIGVAAVGLGLVGCQVTTGSCCGSCF